MGLGQLGERALRSSARSVFAPLAGPRNTFLIRLGEVAHLCIHALAVRRYPCIPVFHGFILHLIYEPKRPHLINAPILVHNS